MSKMNETISGPLDPHGVVIVGRVLSESMQHAMDRERAVLDKALESVRVKADYGRISWQCMPAFKNDGEKRRDRVCRNTWRLEFTRHGGFGVENFKPKIESVALKGFTEFLVCAESELHEVMTAYCIAVHFEHAPTTLFVEYKSDKGTYHLSVASPFGLAFDPKAILSWAHRAEGRAEVLSAKPCNQAATAKGSSVAANLHANGGQAV